MGGDGGEFIGMLLFRAGTVRKLHVEDISQVLVAQVDKVECKAEREQGGMSLIRTESERSVTGSFEFFLFSKPSSLVTLV